jgi:hypothetical protein
MFQPAVAAEIEDAKTIDLLGWEVRLFNRDVRVVNGKDAVERGFIEEPNVANDDFVWVNVHNEI